ncbi:uncharacterized protein N7458_010518 [Penicillium daleae]|uniref:Uncharacterized protein n=1 Tax=Penicillium daleae TaxID=63821 RepID=A0AAD6BZJ7_9EURO|nr:uncharacterized protein N7458_010518 [Penicillium daleae]KAJ5439520.1 hypothetical protein N7458_010518 [Penicillium daleae]
MSSLAGKVFLITGSSKGIGKATALRVASEGANVVINYLRDSAVANDLVNEIGADRALAVQADASKLADLDRLVDAAVGKFGKIDVLIPNAGYLPLKTLETTTEEDFDRTYNLLVKGPYFLAQKAVPHMPVGGRIIFVSTSTARFSSVSPAYLLYTSSKGSIEQMTRILAKNLAPKGILLFLEGKPEAMLKAIAGFSPFNRIGEPDEIASVMAFLSGKDSSWMSGQVVAVNGGMA